MRSNLVTDRLTVSFSLRKLQRKLINYVQFKVFVTNYFRQKRRGGGGRFGKNTGLWYGISINYSIKAKQGRPH